MENLMTNPAFRSYAFCCAILGVKMLFSAVYTGTRRQRHQGYINPEDASFFGSSAATVATEEAPAVAHALRIQRNDLESIPLFFTIGLLYVLTGASPFGARVYFWTYTLARIAHTYFYTNHIQPWRAVSFVVGTAAIVGMIVRIAWVTL